MLTKILHRLIANPWVFDRFQRFTGREETLERLRSYLSGASGKLVLDVGSGTGVLGRIVPATATYIGLDNDWQKHQGFKSKWPAALAIQADATNLCLRNKSIDYATCIALTHHLNDDESARLFQELSRVVKFKLIFLDAVRSEGSFMSSLLWRYDRGAYPRSAEALERLLKQHFEIEKVEHYTIQHTFILCSAIPKDRSNGEPHE